MKLCGLGHPKPSLSGVGGRDCKMGGMIPLGRKRRLMGEVKKAGAEALLVTSPVDVRYLTGFTGSSAAVVVWNGKTALFTDGRYATQVAAEVDAAGVKVDVEIVEGSPVKAACALLVKAGVKRCGFDSALVTVAGLTGMREFVAAKGFWVEMPAAVARLRVMKDEVEQDGMRAAAELGCRLFHDVLEHVVAGTTEMEVAMALEYMARLQGAEGMSFDTIVAGGERSALPHGRATNAKLPRRGFVMLDFGVLLHGYCSDMTRMVHLGAARKGEREVYEAVLEAQAAGVAAVKAGVETGAVDEAARSVLRRAGLAEGFVHSTGHGVGMEIHEEPRVGKEGKVKLKAGMVITIEPGVYVPGKFGVRIEDTVLVTATGCEVLTPATKAWIEL